METNLAAHARIVKTVSIVPRVVALAELVQVLAFIACIYEKENHFVAIHTNRDFCYPLICVMNLSAYLLSLSMILAFPSLGMAQWVQSSTAAGSTKTINNNTMYALVADGEFIYAGTYGGSGSLFTSSDNGRSWLRNTSVSGSPVKLYRNGHYVFTARNSVDQSELSVTTDSGRSWGNRRDFPQRLSIYGLATTGDYFYVAASLGARVLDIWRVSLDLETWVKCKKYGLPELTSLTLDMMYGGANSLVLALNDDIFRSVDNGENWFNITNGLFDGKSQLRVRSIAARDSNLYVSIHRGLFHSSNNGSSWTKIDAGLQRGINSVGDSVVGAGEFVPSDHGVFMIYGGHVFHTTNNGASWQNISENLGDNGVGALAVNNSRVFVATGLLNDTSGGVWSRPITDFTSDVPPNTIGVGDQPALQAFPNPFASSVTLSFTLEYSAHVVCDVVNSLGEVVAQLANDNYNAGTHAMVMQPNTFASGTYVARLRYRNCTQSIFLLFAR